MEEARDQYQVNPSHRSKVDVINDLCKNIQGESQDVFLLLDEVPCNSDCVWQFIWKLERAEVKWCKLDDCLETC